MDRGTGQAGEEHIARLLERRGCEILARNYRCRWGEIDIIARDAQYILFVEVKTRKRRGLTLPLEAITPQKQRRVILAAETYLASHPSGLQPRFDAAAVYTENGRISGEEYLENAFGL